jgi:hypothetical protein
MVAEDGEEVYLDDYVPFAVDRDAARHPRPRFEGQTLVGVLVTDFPVPEGTTEGVDAGVAANPGQLLQPAELVVPREVPVPEPEMDDFEIHRPTEIAESIVPSPSILSDVGGQPHLIGLKRFPPIQQHHPWPWDRHNHHQDSNKQQNLLL